MPRCTQGDLAIVETVAGPEFEGLGHVGQTVAVGAIAIMESLLFGEVMWNVSPALRCPCGNHHMDVYPDECLKPIRGEKTGEPEQTETPKEKEKENATI